MCVVFAPFKAWERKREHRRVINNGKHTNVHNRKPANVHKNNPQTCTGADLRSHLCMVIDKNMVNLIIAMHNSWLMAHNAQLTVIAFVPKSSKLSFVVTPVFVHFYV